MRARRLTILIVLATVAIACGQNELLAQLSDEAILEPPPGADLIADTDQVGSSSMFGSSTGREVLWHYAGTPDEAIAYYVASFPEFQLQQHPTDDRLGGSRGTLGDDYVVGATIQTFTSVDQIPWDTVLLEPDDIKDDPGDGETLIVVGLSLG